jgi:hypothetical protein
MDTEYNHIEDPNNYNEKTFWEEFMEFWEELWKMIYYDFHNAYKFIIANKKYFFTIIGLGLLLQISSITSLGTSFDKYCNKLGDRNQYSGSGTQTGGGGNNAEVRTKTFQEAGLEARKSVNEAKKAVQSAENSSKLQKKIDKKGEESAKAEVDFKKQLLDEKTMKKGSREIKGQFKAQEKAKRHEKDLLKANQERISFFEGLKKKFGGKSLGTTLGGPFFGNMDLIFDSVKYIFYIIGIILTIAGIISLPVTIFLILTYTVFKSLVNRFVAL